MASGLQLVRRLAPVVPPFPSSARLQPQANDSSNDDPKDGHRQGLLREDVDDAVFYDSASMVYMSLNGTSSAGCPAGGVEFSNASSGSALAHEFSAASPTWTPAGSWTVGTGDSTICRIDEMFLEYGLSGISFVFQWTNSGS